jgi:hypothetical protein
MGDLTLDPCFVQPAYLARDGEGLACAQVGVACQAVCVCNQVPHLAVAVGGLGDGLQRVAAAHGVAAHAGVGVAVVDGLVAWAKLAVSAGLGDVAGCGAGALAVLHLAVAGVDLPVCDQLLERVALLGLLQDDAVLAVAQYLRAQAAPKKRAFEC